MQFEVRQNRYFLKRTTLKTCIRELKLEIAVMDEESKGKKLFFF